MQASPYSPQDSAQWDEFVERAPMATFLHTRRFLAYHRERFQDVSLLLKNTKQQLVGLFPAAIDLTDSQRVISHPGITFGSLLHTGDLHGEQMIEALETVWRYYAAQGFTSLYYKAIPYIYHQAPAGDDLYALFRLDARRFRCDLSCAIDLKHPGPRSSRRQRSLKKAIRQGVEVSEGEQFIDDLWEVITRNLEQKLGERPVHTVTEIKSLHSLFPNNIRFMVARCENQTVAGLTLFTSPTVMKAQYIASSDAGNNVSALDLVFEHAITQAVKEGFRYFDFGTSNRNEGKDLTSSLYEFKHEFGGGGVVHEFYEMNLKD